MLVTCFLVILSPNVHYKDKTRTAAHSLEVLSHVPRRHGAVQKPVSIDLLIHTRTYLYQAAYWTAETRGIIGQNSVGPWCPLAKPGFSVYDTCWK